MDQSLCVVAEAQCESFPEILRKIISLSQENKLCFPEITKKKM